MWSEEKALTNKSSCGFSLKFWIIHVSTESYGEHQKKVMKVIRLLAAAMFVTALAAYPALSQQKPVAKPPTTSPTPAPASGGVAVVVPAKIAFIITDAFKDEKIGIARWVAAAKKLQAEFQSKEKELQDLETRIQTLSKELDTLSNSAVVDRKTIVAKQDEIARLQREQKFKKDEGEALFKKRYDEVVGPISADIGKAMDAFAKQRGITLLLEYSRLQEAGIILSADASTDVTVAFIAEYNSKNPVTASSTAAPGR